MLVPAELVQAPEFPIKTELDEAVPLDEIDRRRRVLEFDAHDARVDLGRWAEVVPTDLD